MTNAALRYPPERDQPAGEKAEKIVDGSIRSALGSFLTPLAATGLAIIMIGAVITHVRLNENKQLPVPVVLLIVAVVIAWGRFGPYHF